MTKRIKPTPPKEIVTRAEADQVLGQIREMEIERRRIHLEIEAARKAIEDTHSHQLAHLDEQIQIKAQQLESWSDDNRSEFGDRKSLSMTHGTLGWRLDPPSLKTLPKVTWKEVLRRAGALGFRRFIRSKPEVAKDVILMHREKLQKRGLLAKLGVQVDQQDAFFVEPKIEDPKPVEA